MANEKERISVMQIINISNNDEISAFLTSTLVSHTYQVESTQSIVALWDIIRKNVKLKDDLDYVSAMLATGRIMDYRFEIDDPNIINSIINDINTNIMSRKIESADLQKEMVFALLTSASISRSDTVENIRDIVEQWVQIKDNVEIYDDRDLIAAILTTGRIMELKIRAGGTDFINNIYSNIKKEFDQQASDMTITKKELAAAFLTSAYIEISTKVEKIRDIVDFWLQICNDISIEDQWDYVSVILSTGKIKDMDALHIQGHEGLKDVKDKIKSHIQKIAGK
ncbi:MAG: hypothetical protein JSV56_02750 [Methanomassiliicoccales archaeon]|nr:MAG: hypothetical protein JSV56_02750 [Methanomassiliicoccales archaeon]